MNTTNTDDRSVSEDACALRVQLERSLIVPAKDWATLRERYAETSEEDRLVLAVYIRHVNTTGPLTVALIQECLDTHIGTFTNWEEARRTLGGIFGWPASLDEVDLQDSAGVDITDLLTWSEDGVRNRLRKMLTVVELADAIYVFDAPAEDI